MHALLVMINKIHFFKLYINYGIFLLLICYKCLKSVICIVLFKYQNFVPELHLTIIFLRKECLSFLHMQRHISYLGS